MAQVAVPPEVYLACGLAIVAERLLQISGTANRRGEGSVLIAAEIIPLR
jgi:hypothetical protein